MGGVSDALIALGVCVRHARVHDEKAMGFGDLRSDAGLTALNSFLADKSYIDGCCCVCLFLTCSVETCSFCVVKR